MIVAGDVITRCEDGTPWRVVAVDALTATLRGLRGGGWRIVSLAALERELSGPGGWES